MLSSLFIFAGTTDLHTFLQITMNSTNGHNRAGCTEGQSLSAWVFVHSMTHVVRNSVRPGLVVVGVLVLVLVYWCMHRVLTGSMQIVLVYAWNQNSCQSRFHAVQLLHAGRSCVVAG